MVNLIGVYKVAGETNVHLIELEINAQSDAIDIGEITQEQNGIDRLNWQTPWDEKYLNEQGTEITGDWLEGPKEITDKTRLAFFLHFLDFSQALITPFGEVQLKEPEPIPQRLSMIVKYENPG